MNHASDRYGMEFRLLGLTNMILQHVVAWIQRRRMARRLRELAE